MLFGMLGGLLGGIAIVVMYDRFDGTFKEVESLKVFEIPILAQIPRINNPDEESRLRKHDHLLYGAACAHLVLIGILFAHDLLGFTLVDRFIEKSHLGTVVQEIVSLII